MDSHFSQSQLQSRSYSPLNNPPIPPPFYFRTATQARILRILIENQKVIETLTPDNAQYMVDFLDKLLYNARNSNATRIKHCGSEYNNTEILSLLCKIAKISNRHPKRCDLTGIQRDNNIVACGGFADVYKGRWRWSEGYGPEHDMECCVKVVRIFGDRDNTKTLKIHAKELTLWAHLRHMNLLPFYGSYQDQDGRTCLVSPWLDNGNLREFLQKLPKTPRLPLLQGVISGLAYLHHLGIVHGDLKAANVLISNSQRPLIADFGISSVTLSLNTMSSSGPSSGSSYNGTLRWRAPELLVAEGEGKESRSTLQSDIWSFGCLCYEALTGRLPYGQYSDPKVYTILCQRSELPGHRGLYSPSSQSMSESSNFHIFMPTTSEREPQNDDIDAIWNIVGNCWDYIPERRPSAETLYVSLEDLVLATTLPLRSLHIHASNSK